MKIAINDCYGGFSLSKLARDRLVELGFPELKIRGSSTDPDWYHIIQDHNHRDNPLLIKMIEELGVQANGRVASLKIIEIPDGVEWEIEEYDGWEWVSEKHRTWG